MAILFVLAAFTLVFWLMRKNIGASFLATVAGIAIHQSFGPNLVNFFANLLKNTPTSLIETCVYLALVVGFPIILYLNSSHGGLFGLLRIAESLIFAALLTSLIAPQIAYFFSFDTLSVDINNFISGARGSIMLFGAILAYLEILLARD